LLQFKISILVIPGEVQLSCWIRGDGLNILLKGFEIWILDQVRDDNNTYFIKP